MYYAHYMYLYYYASCPVFSAIAQDATESSMSKCTESHFASSLCILRDEHASCAHRSSSASSDSDSDFDSSPYSPLSSPGGSQLILLMSAARTPPPNTNLWTTPLVLNSHQ